MAAPKANANDITTVISALASRQSNRPKSQPLSGSGQIGGQRVTGELAPHSEAQSQTQPMATRVESLCTRR